MDSPRSGTVPRNLERYGFHLAQLRQALERLRFDLANTLARQPEPAADVLKRLRLRVREPVTEDDHVALSLGERGQGLRKRLAAQRALDGLLWQRVVVGDEVAEDGVLLLADRLIEAGRSPRGRLDLMCLATGRFASSAISSSVGSRPN